MRRILSTICTNTLELKNEFLNTRILEPSLTKSTSIIADESLTKQICPVTQNTSYETTALSIVQYYFLHLALTGAQGMLMSVCPSMHDKLVKSTQSSSF